MQPRKSLNKYRVTLSGNLLRDFYLQFTKIAQPKGAKYFGKSKFMLSIIKIGIANYDNRKKEVPYVFEDSLTNERLYCYLSGQAKKDFADTTAKHKETDSDMLRALIFIGLKVKSEQDKQALELSGLTRRV